MGIRGFKISTTGSLSAVTLSDLEITLVHPISNQDLLNEPYTLAYDDVVSSDSLYEALKNGHLESVNEDDEDIDIINVGRTNLTFDSITATTFFGDGSNLSGITNTPSISVMEVGNTDTVTNINTSTSTDFTTTVPVSGTIITGSDLSNFTKTTNGIQCNFDGYILAFTSIQMFASAARINVQTSLRLNTSTLFGSIGSSGYIRSNTGHNESSVVSFGTIQVSNGDEITVGSRRESTATASTIMSVPGGSNLIVIKLN